MDLNPLEISLMELTRYQDIVLIICRYYLSIKDILSWCRTGKTMMKISNNPVFWRTILRGRFKDCLSFGDIYGMDLTCPFLPGRMVSLYLRRYAMHLEKGEWKQIPVLVNLGKRDDHPIIKTDQISLAPSRGYTDSCLRIIMKSVWIHRWDTVHQMIRRINEHLTQSLDGVNAGPIKYFILKFIDRCGCTFRVDMKDSAYYYIEYPHTGEKRAMLSDPLINSHFGITSELAYEPLWPNLRNLDFGS